MVFQLTFARFYLPAFIPNAEKAIYLDDDIIVQGKTTIKGGNGLVHKPNADEFFFKQKNVFHAPFHSLPLKMIR